MEHTDLYYLPERNEAESNRLYALRTIRLNIISLHMKPGSSINEADLSDALEMSRTPIHEAINQLRGEWLVDVFPQVGIRVSRINADLVKEGYETRILLESNLLEEMAGKFTYADIQKLLQHVQKQREYIDRFSNSSATLSEQEKITLIEQIISADDAFHHTLYVMSGMRYTWDATRGLCSHYDRMRYLDAYDGSYRYTSSCRDHELLCDYLMMGLPTKLSAREFMYNHMASFRGNIIDKIRLHPEYFR